MYVVCMYVAVDGTPKQTFRRRQVAAMRVCIRGEGQDE